MCVAPLDERADEATPARRFGAGELGRVLDLAPAPDASAVALTSHDGRLLVFDPESGALRELARGAAGEISDLCWSPDSAWLAYCDPVEPDLNRIMMARLADDTLVAVTPPRFVDFDPTFTSDGRYLAFLSRRSFDPIYDEHAFDLTFPASIAAVPGAVGRAHPVAVRGQPGRATGVRVGGDPRGSAGSTGRAGRDRGGRGGGAVRRLGAGGKKTDKPPTVTVDIEGLADRVVPIPVAAARYGGMRAGKDCLLWLRYPVAGVLGDGRAGTEDKPQRPVLERYDLTRRKLEVIADPVTDFSVSGDGARLLVLDRSTLRVLRTDRSSSSAPDGNAADGGADEFDVDTRRIVVTVDPTAEWRQMFDEAGTADARPLLESGHGRRGLGGRAGPLPAAGGRGGQPRRSGRPALGAAGRAGHLARLRVRRGRGRLVRPARAARRRPGPGRVRHRLAGAAGAAAGDLGPGRAQPAVRTGGGRPGR